MQLYIAEHTFIFSFPILRKRGIQNKRQLYASLMIATVGIVH